ncbi:VOC family protein [Neolewinella aurantiaca]|uniref:VOC family protein n=1 Tax=Neolewinella aurantiaca TaxID=2602767 RepID=UPI001650A776|nr:VOC family protein [Neolewinella aurantiaca]
MNKPNNSPTIDTLYLPSPSDFLTALFNELERSPGLLDHLQLDHLCYRVETTERYEELKSALLQDNELLVESPIKGRQISTFRMAEPFQFRGRDIWLLELPEPKPGSPYPEGWEHVEFVTDRPLAAFSDWITEHLGIQETDIDRSGVNKPLNADLRLRLKGGLSVKFHELPLDEVIRIELGG